LNIPSNTTKNNLSNKKFLLPNLIDTYKKPDKSETRPDNTNLDDSYHSTPEEKAETEKKKKRANYFGYEKTNAEEQQYHFRRINDLLKLELNFLRRHDRVENNNKQHDYSEIFYQFKKQM
jgi:hypothetical protein